MLFCGTTCRWPTVGWRFHSPCGLCAPHQWTRLPIPTVVLMSSRIEVHSLALDQSGPFDRYVTRVLLAAAAIACLVGALLVSVPAVKANAVGLSRNSEAFAFVGLALVDALVGGRFVDRRTKAWFSVLAAMLIAAEVSQLGLPGGLTTLREPILAVLLMGIVLRSELRTRYLIAAASAVVVVGELFGPLQEPGTIIIDHAEVFGSLIVGVVVFRRLMSWPELIPWGTQTSWILVIAILVGVPIICVALNSNGVDSLAADGAFEAGLVWLQRNMEAYVAGVLLLVTAVVARIVPGRLLSRTLA